MTEIKRMKQREFVNLDTYRGIRVYSEADRALHHTLLMSKINPSSSRLTWSYRASRVLKPLETIYRKYRNNNVAFLDLNRSTQTERNGKSEPDSPEPNSKRRN